MKGTVRETGKTTGFGERDVDRASLTCLRAGVRHHDVPVWSLVHPNFVTGKTLESDAGFSPLHFPYTRHIIAQVLLAVTSSSLMRMFFGEAV